VDVVTPPKEYLLKMEGASLVISKCRPLPVSIRGMVAEISSVFVEPEHRGKGLGDALIQKVCNDFDEVGGALILQADNETLAKWYSRFGFIKFQDRPILMIRLPRTPPEVLH